MCVESHRNLGAGRVEVVQVPRSKPREIPAAKPAAKAIPGKPAPLAITANPEASFQEKHKDRIESVRTALQALGIELNEKQKKDLTENLDLAVTCEDESTLKSVEDTLNDVRKKIEAATLAAERAAAEEARKAEAERARLEAARLAAEKAAAERAAAQKSAPVPTVPKAAAPSVETLSVGTTITVTINEDQFKKARQQNKGGEVAVTGGHQVKLELPSKKELKVTLVRANPSKPLNEQGLRDAVLAWLSK